MVYTRVLLFFGLLPLAVLALLALCRLPRFKGTLLWVVLCILWVSISWENIAIDRIWFYAPHAILGPHLLRLPLEEYAFFVIDGLLVTVLGLLLRKRQPDEPA
jgi:lycopene cyclase domain-containing protein